MKTLRKWSDEHIAMALIVDLCRWYDAGGLSHGRSLESTLAETVRDLLRRYRPGGDIATWPDRSSLLSESTRRIRKRDERRRKRDRDRIIAP